MMTAQSTSCRREHDVVEPLALLQVAPDQQPEAARQLEHAHQRAMRLGAFALVEPAIDGLGPARLSSTPGRQRADIAGEPVAARRRHEIEAGAGPPRRGIR